MRKYHCLLVGLALIAVAAGTSACPAWPHSKKFPVEIVSASSPTEFKVKVLADGQTYAFRLAHVIPLKLMKDENTIYQKRLAISKQYITPTQSDDAQTVRESWIEFEEKTFVTDTGPKGEVLVGYLFFSEKNKKTHKYTHQATYPVNVDFIGHEADQEPISTYRQEFYGDSKAKKVFDWYAQAAAK